ncbi:hypothetical protein R6242_08195 [Iodobacter sp. CM08]|uniref:hypothetical protein n=1 Tax=Iodobacter sp. CM08 TaxID=3085902 RepID=UPI002981D5D6|nr:hypothetical protein [Iodobacter sp. CM08]MDW5416554.1 hypothetical protein [Iodobacter sp. CM08]
MKTYQLYAILLLSLSTPSYAAAWKELGHTSSGNTISVIDTQFRKGAIITTRIRNDLHEPKPTENGNITRIESDLQINCSKKTVSPIRTFLFDEQGQPELSVNLRGGKEFLKKDADSAMGLAIEQLC